jgi:hypothetical protein
MKSEWWVRNIAEVNGRTVGEQFATILLPNTVAQGETGQHKTKPSLKEMPMKWT